MPTKIVVGSIPYEDEPREVILGASLGGISCVISHDFRAMIGNHGKQTMRAIFNNSVGLCVQVSLSSLYAVASKPGSKRALKAPNCLFNSRIG